MVCFFFLFKNKNTGKFSFGRNRCNCEQSARRTPENDLGNHKPTSASRVCSKTSVPGSYCKYCSKSKMDVQSETLIFHSPSNVYQYAEI